MDYELRKQKGISRVKLKPGDTIGILGGGQLGRMLAMAAARLGLKCQVFSPDPDSPAFDVVLNATCAVFFFKQKTAYEIGLGIPAEPLFRSVERPVKAAELFAFTLRVRAGNTDVLTDAEENVRQKLRAEGVM